MVTLKILSTEPRVKNFKIDEYIEISISSKKTPKQRRIEDILEKLTNYDMLIVTELSRLGRNTAEVIELFNSKKKYSGNIHQIKY
ncbi:MAG: recombinase family protein [Rickettsia endosymbiont of Labidopullus appendiculatus]|nr:recombinase family protein [Rickettsia endosymbiont of Labidopullus appendiculatus]